MTFGQILFVIFAVAILLLISFLKTPTGKGFTGELVVKILLGKNKPGFRIVNNLLFFDGKKSVQIDHLVVTRHGIFVIETKNYSGRIYGKEDQDFWTQVLAFGRVKNKLYNPISQNKGHIFSLKQKLNDFNSLIFESIIVFMGRADLQVETTTPVIWPIKLKKTIAGLNSSQNFTEEMAENIYLSLVVAKQENTVTLREHVDSIHQRLEGIANNICPQCGSHLILRKGKNGDFWGCSNYPKCKFTKK